MFENRFRKLDTGILLFVEDLEFGSAINTVMDENRFDHVAMDIMTGPGAAMSMAAASAETTPMSMWTKVTITTQQATPDILALFDLIKPTIPRAFHLLEGFNYVWWAKNQL